MYCSREYRYCYDWCMAHPVTLMRSLRFRHVSLKGWRNSRRSRPLIRRRS